ncbi:MAG: hypothetical protein HQL23_01555 [Candidatus Omnitrophica bacterium]|nr:hypothetical protein [Candidatus Omnitrophota bacterium]
MRQLQIPAIIILFFLILNPLVLSAEPSGRYPVQIHGVYVGMPRDDFFKLYPHNKARTFLKRGEDEWLTFNDPLKEDFAGLLSFHIQNGKVQEWLTNSRKEAVREYLDEFCGPSGKVYMAIQNVLERIPFADFVTVTDRRRPVVFTEYYAGGTARFGNSSEIIASPEYAPAFENGFTLIKLSTALDDLAKSTAPIEGVIAHELAHRVLEHILKGNVSCDAEREANALVKKWGFAAEYQAARKIFGRKRGEPKSCREK